MAMEAARRALNIKVGGGGGAGSFIRGGPQGPGASLRGLLALARTGLSRLPSSRAKTPQTPPCGGVPGRGQAKRRSKPVKSRSNTARLPAPTPIETTNTPRACTAPWQTS